MMDNNNDNEEYGEYGRTNLGKIIKFAWIESSEGVIDDRKVILFDTSTKTMNTTNTYFYYFEQGEHIVKHSEQLIDLIEVKDIIKYRIDNISTTLETKGYIEGIVDVSDEEMLQRIKNQKSYKILEILTHEQFEQNSYKVGGEDE